MVSKIVIVIFSFFSLCYANTPKLSIGSIDVAYEDIINQEQLRALVLDIKQQFESQLNKELFELGNNATPINLIYVTPSKLEESIKNNIQKLNQNQEKFEKYQAEIVDNKKQIARLKKEFSKKNKILDTKIKSLNVYINKINQQKNISVEEYNQINKQVNKEKEIIKKETDNLRIEYKKLNDVINSFNQKISVFNKMVINNNNLIRKIEFMSRGLKKIRGKTFINQNTVLKNKYKDGKILSSQKEVKNYVTRIEVYGFDDLNELKAVLAHEIGHFLGLPHIDKKQALMNPIIQSNQVENLKLTKDDIRLFEKYLK